MYPQSSDGRNTFVIFADWVATLAAQPPAAPVERGCCNKCQNASECETGCKLACTCGGDPGQPASEHDISCPAGLSRISAGNGAVTEAAQFLLDRLDEFDPGEDEPEREYHGHVTPAIARLRSALTEAVPQTLPDSHLRALNEFVTLSEEDYCSDDTEEGDWAEPDDEPVAAGQDHVSCVTFGSVRRAREAIDALLALSRPQSGSGQQ
jgi:hypothetical protein